MKILNFFSVVVIASLLFSCEFSNQKSPEQTAEEFLKAVYLGNIESAKLLSTEKADGALSIIQKVKYDSILAEIPTEFLVTTTLKKQTDTQANCTFDIVFFNKYNFPNNKINLKFIENQWQVVMNTQEIVNLIKLIGKSDALYAADH